MTGSHPLQQQQLAQLLLLLLLLQARQVSLVAPGLQMCRCQRHLPTSTSPAVPHPSSNQTQLQLKAPRSLLLTQPPPWTQRCLLSLRSCRSPA